MALHTRGVLNCSVGGSDCQVIESAGDCTSKLCRNIGSSDPTVWNVFDGKDCINMMVQCGGLQYDGNMLL